MPNEFRPLRQAIPVALGAAIALAGCTAGAPPSLVTASPTPLTPSRSPSSSPSPDAGAIDYPTGATDVVLRYEQGGGLMDVGGALASAPIFTLYGDGSVIFRDPDTQAPADESGLFRYPPFRTARLAPEQIESLLQFAVIEGGLGTAREQYDNPTLADAGNAVFTINAGGQSKQVTVAGLFESDATAPDQLSRSQFLALAARLRKFDESGEIPTAELEPEQFRVHLIDAAGFEPPAVRPWPWPELEPADFAGQGSFPFRIMTAEEIAQLDDVDASGGLNGYYVEAPDGKFYGLVVRPILPDEAP